MGDARHKKSPPPADLEEDVTDSFRRDVKQMLEANKIYNKVQRLKYGMDGYRISNRTELAKAIDCDPNTIKHLLGGVRATTKTKHIARSVYVGKIREVLGLTSDMKISVSPERAPTVRLLANLPDADFKAFEAAILRMARSL